jgi:hypothetical protein
LHAQACPRPRAKTRFFNEIDPLPPVALSGVQRQVTEWSGHPSQLLGDSSSAIADIGAVWVLRQQCGGLLTVAALSSWTAASCICEPTLSTLNGRSGQRGSEGSAQGATDIQDFLPNNNSWPIADVRNAATEGENVSGRPTTALRPGVISMAVSKIQRPFARQVGWRVLGRYRSSATRRVPRSANDRDRARPRTGVDPI